ncbi:MAG TPA: amidohydrolase family protein [Hyphomicrobiales bacterium]|nr:amidohydrolase family protein [Hyphomicrobiales bacterium]
MNADYLAFHPNPSLPAFKTPDGAVDAHCHVFGPAAVFPFAAERKYTPVDAPKEKLFALRDHLGFARNVIVQASCHGSNNDALKDALLAAKGLARGVAVVDSRTSDTELSQLNEAGVRGVRFNFIRRLVDETPQSVFRGIAERVNALGWHSAVYFEAADFLNLKPFLSSLPGILVIDHMGRPDVTQGTDSEAFQAICDFVSENTNVWIKVSCPERLTVAGSPYDDVVPFAQMLVTSCPDRVLWGTDWPHPNMKSHMPDDGALVDFIPRIAPTEALQKALLVDNPMRLYWPEEFEGSG